ncbi:MAG: hypothetical protein HPY50_07370 [Firmicutes bacterium]|nr:hypothetical protein [Bacillota bacterium]
MFWPSNTDYQDAVQNPALCFSDPELMRGVLVLDSLGLPRPVNGYFSTVYQLDCGTKKYAVKCFLKYLPDREKRYSKISRYLKARRLSFMVDFEFLREGIKVQGRWFPVLKMEWVEGEHLNCFVERNLSRPRVIWELAQSFLGVAQELKRNSIAHGDLQHGNILVVGGGIKLIDYDGMFIPAFKGMRSDEVGHRNYQHPYRGEKDFGSYMDHFSSLVIYLSLLAVSINPTLWKRHGGGEENLLFRKEDFTRSDQSPLLHELNDIRDGTVRSLCASLKSFALVTDLCRIPPLDFKRLQGIETPAPEALIPEWLQGYVRLEAATKKAPSGGTHREAFLDGSREPASIIAGIENYLKAHRLPFFLLLGLFIFFVALGAFELLNTSAVFR